MKKTTQILKFIGKSIFAFILISLIFWTICLAILQTQMGQKWIFNHFISYIEQKTQTQITVERIRFSFPIKFEIDQLKVYQTDQLLISLNSAELIGSYPHLIEGRFVASNLKADDIRIFGLPKFKAEPAMNSSPKIWSETFLPIYVKAENIHIQNVTLSPNLVDEISISDELKPFIKNSFFDIQGSFSHNPFKSFISTYLTFTSNDIENKRSPINLTLDCHYGDLILTVDTIHFSLPANEHIPIPCLFDIKGTANGSTEDWQYLLTNPIEKNLKISGIMNISCHPLEKLPPLTFLNEQPTTLSLEFNIRSQNTFEIKKIKSENSYFQLEGKGKLIEGLKIQNVSFKGSFHHLNHLEKWLGHSINGNVFFEGKMRGTRKNPILNIHVKSNLFSIDAYEFEHVFSNIYVKRNEENLASGFITLKLDHQNHPWQFATAFNLAPDLNLKIHHLHLDALDTYTEGSFTYSLSDFTTNGTLKMTSDDLNELSTFFNFPIQGKANLLAQFHTLPIDSQKISQRCEITFQAEDLVNEQGKIKKFNSEILLKAENNDLSKIKIKSDIELKQLQYQTNAMAYFSHRSLSTIDLKQRILSKTKGDWQINDLQTTQGTLELGHGTINLLNLLQTNQEGLFTAYLEGLKHNDHSIEKLFGKTSLFSEGINNSFSVSLESNSREAISFDLEGLWNYHNHDIQGTISSFKGSWRNQPFQLHQPVNFIKSPHLAKLDNLTLSWNQVELNANFIQEDQSIETLFSTNKVSLQNIKPIFPDLPVNGSVTVSGQLKGDLNNPKGSIEIDLEKLEFSEEILSKNLSLDGKVFIGFDSQETQIQSELIGLDHQPFKINGKIPISFNLPSLSFHINEEAQIDFNIDAEGDLDPYLHLFYDGTDLSSHIKLALKIAGKIREPQIFGSIDIRNGSFESLTTGANFHNIQAHLEGDGSKLNLTQFSAEDVEKGTVSAKGFIDLEPSQNFPFEIKIDTSKIFIINADFASLSASGFLNLAGNSQSAKLTGNLTVDEAIVRLEETIPREIKSVEIRYINIPENEQKLAFKGLKENSSFINLDVKLDLPQHIYIQGHHLTSEWEGTINTTGTIDDPLFNGDLGIVYGEYDFNGKIFNLTQGNIHFAGPISKKTTLYIVASKEINNVSPSYQSQNSNFGSRSKSIDHLRADIIVKGFITKPVISFRSDPPLSQREILSYILFNRGISDNTADQGDQLSQSFISLNSSEQTSSTTDFLSRLRNNIGIDRLDFASENDQNSEYSLQVGKYITENIFVSINKSINAAANRIAIEANLKENFKLQADVGDDSQVRTSIKWKKNY